MINKLQGSMMPIKRTKFFFLLSKQRMYQLFLFCFLACYTLTAMPVENTKTIRVLAISAPPYVSLYDKTPTGIAVDVWKTIAREMNWSYQITPVDGSTDVFLQQLVSGKYDVMIGGLFITAPRLEKVQFSNPILMTQWGVLREKRDTSFFSSLGKLVAEVLYSPIFWGLLIMLFLIAQCMWLFERGKTLPKSYISGMNEALWEVIFGFCTQYLDTFFVKTFIGRCLALLLVVFATIAFAIVLGAITSIFISIKSSIAHTIDTVEELQQLSIGIVQGSAAAAFTDNLQIQVQTYKNSEDAVEALQSNKVDAVLEPVSVLQQYLKQYPHRGLVLETLTFGYQPVSFAFPYESPYLKSFNLKLAQLQGQYRIGEICQRYLDAKKSALCNL